MCLSYPSDGFWCIRYGEKRNPILFCSRLQLCGHAIVTVRFRGFRELPHVQLFLFCNFGTYFSGVQFTFVLRQRRTPCAISSGACSFEIALRNASYIRFVRSVLFFGRLFACIRGHPAHLLTATHHARWACFVALSPVARMGPHVGPALPSLHGFCVP